MNEKNYRKLTGCIFGIIAVAHLIRAITVTPVAVGTMFIPTWVSWVAFLVAAYLGYQGLRRR